MFKKIFLIVISILGLIYLSYYALLMNSLSLLGHPQPIHVVNIFDEMYANLDKVETIPDATKKTTTTMDKDEVEFKSTYFVYTDFHDYTDIHLQQDYANKELSIGYTKKTR